MGRGAQDRRFVGDTRNDYWVLLEIRAVQSLSKDVDLVLIADDPWRATMLRDTMEKSGISGVIRRLSPGTPAIDCARRSGAYRDKDMPDLILFDYVDPDEETTSTLRDIAFSKQRARVPIVLLTSDSSQELLNAGEIADSDAIMFSPTSLTSFVAKMKIEKRSSFFKAIDTLFQYGPILVRTPQSWRRREYDHIALSA